MGRRKTLLCPTSQSLIEPVFIALKELVGSATNDEVYNFVIDYMHLSPEIIDELHNGTKNQTQLAYNLNWARTYLKNAGIIENSARGVWSLKNGYSDKLPTSFENIANELYEEKILQADCLKSEGNQEISCDDVAESNNESWREVLKNILKNMDPFAFERLSMRLLRACGFDNVKVTKKSRDGGIDGYGKWKINPILGFNIAFQCKRYKTLVRAKSIRDFRGALTTDIEKGVFITTGEYTVDAKKEAEQKGKIEIELIDGDKLIDLLCEHQLGVKAITAYDIDKDFFDKI